MSLEIQHLRNPYDQLRDLPGVQKTSQVICEGEFPKQALAESCCLPPPLWILEAGPGALWEEELLKVCS